MFPENTSAWWRNNPLVTSGPHPTDLCHACGVSRDRHVVSPDTTHCSALWSSNAIWHLCALPRDFEYDALPGTDPNLQMAQEKQGVVYRDPNARTIDGTYFPHLPVGYTE